MDRSLLFRWGKICDISLDETGFEILEFDELCCTGTRQFHHILEGSFRIVEVRCNSVNSKVVCFEIAVVGQRSLLLIGPI